MFRNYYDLEIRLKCWSINCSRLQSALILNISLNRFYDWGTLFNKKMYNKNLSISYDSFGSMFYKLIKLFLT